MLIMFLLIICVIFGKSLYENYTMVNDLNKFSFIEELIVIVLFVWGLILFFKNI